MIFCIKEMARRHYDLDVDVLLIKSTKDNEAALFDKSCDVLVEIATAEFGAADINPLTL